MSLLPSPRDYALAPYPGTAIVTGGASGIGAEIARAFVSLGVPVAICDRDIRGAEALAHTLGPSSKAYALDLAKTKEIAPVVETILGEMGPVGTLVNCAGVVFDESLATTGLAAWDTTFAVNLTAVFRTCQILAPHMEAQGGGRIVNIASEAAHRVFPNRVAYASSKAALINFTRSMAVELAPKGITANTISPTVVMTEMGQRVWTEDKAGAFLAGIPAGRFALCEDIAAATLYLCSKTAGTRATPECLYASHAWYPEREALR